MTMRLDDKTTEQIWRELSDRLRQFVRSRVDSAADADDIVQSVFLRIHEKIGELRQSERLQSWVFQIARNAIADRYRRRRDPQPDGSAEEPAPEPDDAQNLNAEVASCLAGLIEQLPDEQRRAIALYELEGVPQKAIAERESISLSAAKSRIQRGRQALEVILRDCCQFQLDARGNVLDYEANASGDCDAAGCRTDTCG